MKNISNKILDILPGLVVCIIIAYFSKYLGTFVPSIGGATLSIFIGILFGNTLGTNPLLNPGSKFSEKNLLNYSIVLLGGTLSFKTILNLKIYGVCFIMIQMCVTIFAALLIGKKLGFSNDFRYLMASGNAVCGSSAIGSTAPVIHAKEDDKTLSITIVNLTGTILMILLPLIASMVFSSKTLETSALIGGVLQSIGQVVASASMVSEPVRDLATIFKIVRIIFLVFVVLFLGNLKNRTENRSENKHKNENEEIKTCNKSKIKIPWYVLGFFIMCILFSLEIISPNLSKSFKLVSNNFEIIALAGIGMRVKFKTLISQGPKSIFYGLCIACVQITSAITLINILL